jgi:hypothetical protein
MLLQFRRRDRRRLQASFRRGTFYPFWRLVLAAYLSAHRTTINGSALCVALAVTERD